MTHLLIQADAVRLPLANQSVDLVLGSPPYCDARTYGIDAQRNAHEWVAWMLDVTTEALRVSRGAVLWVVGGVTRDRTYWPACEGLAWEWFKRGGSAYRPCYWHRVGIPGSGGDQWFRADVEYVLCFKRPGKLPWTDNCANGKPPKYRPGGEMSYRNSDGIRINDKYSIVDTLDILKRFSCATQTDPPKVLQELRLAIEEKKVSAWFSGILARLQQEKLLRPRLRGRVTSEGKQRIQGGCQRASSGSQDHSENPLREMRYNEETTRPSRGRESEEQCAEQPPSTLPWVPPEGARERFATVQDLWSDESSVGIVRQALPEIQAAWRSHACQDQSIRSGQARSRTKRMKTTGPRGDVVERAYMPPVKANPGNLIKIPVGGGLLGSDMAHENEAPFPEALAEWFLLSLCPRGGTVLDPFSGSGTTVAVAERIGRHGIGSDLRASQAELSKRRVERPHQPTSTMAKRAKPEQAFSLKGLS